MVRPIPMAIKLKSTNSYIQAQGMGSNSDHVVRFFLGENDDIGYVGIGFFNRLSGGTNPTPSLNYSAIKVVIIKSNKTVTRLKEWI